MASRFRVRSPADFARVEGHVSSLFLSTSSGASILRSASFMRFRMRCLYRACRSVHPWHAPDGRLVVSLERGAPGGSGGWVTDAPRDDAHNYDNSWDGKDDDVGEADEADEEGGGGVDGTDSDMVKVK